MGLNINLTGEAKKFSGPSKVLLEEGAYPGKITRVSDIITVPDFSGNGEVDKVVLDVTLEGHQTEDGEPVVLSLWSSTSITKGGTRGNRVFNNSKMFDILDKARALEKLQQYVPVIESLTSAEEQKKALTDFLKETLESRGVNVLTKNRKGKDGSGYSGVDKILTFADGSVPQPQAAPVQPQAPEVQPQAVPQQPAQ